MEDEKGKHKHKDDYDISIIRPEIKAEQIKFRGSGFSEQRLNAIKRGLRTFHTLELMAQTIYKYQISKEQNELDRMLIAAMCNEMTHYQDFQVKLYEYNFTPSIFRWAYWIVGIAIGCISKFKGAQAILKTGIWVETKAVDHYEKLLYSIDWDDETRAIIEKDQADEFGHIDHWREMLKTSTN